MSILVEKLFEIDFIDYNLLRLSNFSLPNARGVLLRLLFYQSQNNMDCLILLGFLYLTCFVASTCDIYLSMLNFNGLCSSATYLFTRLPHRGLYNYNGRQIELFYLKWFNYG